VDDQKEHMLQLIARSKELRDLMKKSQIAPEEEETLAEPPKTQDLSTVANRIFNSK
jgi:arsenate reductase-like glutaredoxin family protein